MYHLENESPARNPIRILAALDQGYVPQLCVMLTSIYLNNPGLYQFIVKMQTKI